MESGFSFPGAFTDRHGTEQITWRVSPATRRQPPGVTGYLIETTIRSVTFWGYDFDGLEPCDPDQAVAAGLPLSHFSGDLAGSVVQGDLPCTIEVDGQRAPTAVSFTLTLPGAERGPERQYPSPKNLHLTLIVADRRFDVDDDWFEDGILRLDEETRRSGATLVCCATCLFSDYSPAGHGLMGMRCHRSAKEQYLAVRSRADYWPVPVTEDVMETYLCPEYERRIPGTGYRGRCRHQCRERKDELSGTYPERSNQVSSPARMADQTKSSTKRDDGLEWRPRGARDDNATRL